MQKIKLIKINLKLEKFDFIFILYLISLASTTKIQLKSSCVFVCNFLMFISVYMMYNCNYIKYILYYGPEIIIVIIIFFRSFCKLVRLHNNLKFFFVSD